MDEKEEKRVRERETLRISNMKTLYCLDCLRTVSLSGIP